MYKRVTYDFGNVRQVLKYYPGNYGAPGLSRSKKRKRTGEEIRKNNERSRVRKLQRLILANFRTGRTVCLTYQKGKRPETIEEALQQRRQFLKKIRTECQKAGIPWKFIVVTERGKKGQALHHHLVIEDISKPVDLLRVISKAWTFGRVNSTKMIEEEDAFYILADYLLKKDTKAGLQGTTYSRSRNLIIPEPRKEEIRRRTWSKEPKAPQGWHVVKGSVINAISPGGWPTQRYMLRKDEEPARKANERDRLRNMDERRGKNGRETGPGCQQRGNSGGDHAAWNY